MIPPFTARLALPLVLLATLASACAAPMPPAPTAPVGPPVDTVPRAPEPVVSAPPVVVAPPAEPQGADARLQISPAQSEIKLGSRATLALTNVDDHAFRYRYPGGTNGCARFHWGLTLIDARGRTYVDHHRSRGQMCTAVMIPPSWVVIEPGRSEPIAVDTGAAWYELGADTAVDREPPARALQPGTYDVVVGTPNGQVRGKIRILPKA